MARLDEQRITDALNHAEPVNKKTMDSLTELTSYPDLPAEDVTVIPVTIRYKDAPDKTYDPIKRQCWRSSPHGRALQTLSISRTMALVVLALTVPDFWQ